MSKNSESDLGMPYVLIFFPGKDQFAILYFVDDRERSGDSLVCRITPGPNKHTHTRRLCNTEGSYSRNM